MEHVVTEDKGAAVVPDERLTDDERLSQAIRSWLFGEGEFDSPLRSVTQKFPESRGIVGVVMTKMSRIPAPINVDNG